MTNHEFIYKLKKLDGALDYDGECSTQVVFLLANGKTLRIGVTEDDDVAVPELWCDQYTGLLGEFK